jgi:hypothetical protein
MDAKCSGFVCTFAYQCCSALGVADVSVLPCPEEVLEQAAVSHRGDCQHIRVVVVLTIVVNQQVLDLMLQHTRRQAKQGFQ